MANIYINQALADSTAAEFSVEARQRVQRCKRLWVARRGLLQAGGEGRVASGS